jgi:hypothetical protein
MLVSLGLRMLVSLGIVLVSLLLLLSLFLLTVLSDEVPVVDCGGLQAPMAANTIINANRKFFIN